MQNNWQLFWGQGQFLTPQHFQQQDLYHLWQRQYFWRLGNPFGWGVVSARFREEGFAANTVEIARCEVVTRDGVLIQAGSDFVYPNARIEPRSFQGLMDPAGGPLSVYVALPRVQTNQRNVLATGQNSVPGVVPPRYRLSRHKRPDLFDHDARAAELSFVEYNVPILFDREPAFAGADQAAELIKIAEILPLASATGARLSPSYIAPSIHIGASPALMSRLLDLRDMLTAKAQEFEVGKRRRPDPIQMQKMQTVARFVPALHHATEHGHAHPEPVYGMLRQMLAEFSVFSEEMTTLGRMAGAPDSELQDLPAYDHERIQLCFETVIGRLQILLRSLDSGGDTGIPLVRDGRFYRASLPPAVFEGERTRYYLMIDSPVRGDALWERLQRTGKLAPTEDMQRLLTQALFGLRIELTPIPPESLPQRGGNKTFFQIDTRHPVWARIRDQLNIALYCDLEPQETAIKLYVVRDE